MLLSFTSYFSGWRRCLYRASWRRDDIVAELCTGYFPCCIWCVLSFTRQAPRLDEPFLRGVVRRSMLLLPGETAAVGAAASRCHGDEGGHCWDSQGLHVPQDLHSTIRQRQVSCCSCWQTTSAPASSFIVVIWPSFTLNFMSFIHESFHQSSQSCSRSIRNFYIGSSTGGHFCIQFELSNKKKIGLIR